MASLVLLRAFQTSGRLKHAIIGRMTELVVMETAAAPTPVWVTVLAAVLVLIGTTASAVPVWRAAKAAERGAAAAASASVKSAEEAASTSRFVARSERFAQWQSHKREVYGALLDRVRDSRDAGETKDKILAVVHQFDAAYLLAGEELVPSLDLLRAGWKETPDGGEFDELVQDCIRAMAKDVQPPKRVELA